MRAAVITFPGSNCNRDLEVAFNQLFDQPTLRVWHRETSLPQVDVIGVPGGFSYGDYLRCGAIAARSPVMREVVARAEAGVPVIGICNGFQILCESGLLPGALIRNAGLAFVCRHVDVEVATSESIFTSTSRPGTRLRLPVAHHDGNYVIDDEGLARLEAEDRIAFRYAEGDNPNGSRANIAGILSANRKVLGMMPHPERAIAPELGSSDGCPLFDSLKTALG